jgi:hypothetical protein
VDSQLEFVAYDLCNEHQTIGMSLKLAGTLEEAKAAVVPYVRMLSEDGLVSRTFPASKLGQLDRCNPLRI